MPATGILELDLKHEDPRIRVHAAEQALAANRVDLVSLMVSNLRDRDGAVRLFTSAALKRLTGRDFGYKPYGTVIEREEAIAAWEAWLGLRDGEGENDSSDTVPEPAMAGR